MIFRMNTLFSAVTHDREQESGDESQGVKEETEGNDDDRGKTKINSKWRWRGRQWQSISRVGGFWFDFESSFFCFPTTKTEST